MEPTYKQAIENFKPQFGNANHIAAVRIIPRITNLQGKLDELSVAKKNAQKALLKEIRELEARVVGLLSTDTPLSTYPPTYPQDA